MFTDKSYWVYLEKCQSHHGSNGNAERHGAIIVFYSASSEGDVIVRRSTTGNRDGSRVSSCASESGGCWRTAIEVSACSNVGVCRHTGVSSRHSCGDFALHSASSKGDIIVRGGAHGDSDSSSISGVTGVSSEGWGTASGDEASSDIGISGHSGVSGRDGGGDLALVDVAS